MAHTKAEEEAILLTQIGLEKRIMHDQERRKEASRMAARKEVMEEEEVTVEPSLEEVMEDEASRMAARKEMMQMREDAAYLHWSPDGWPTSQRDDTPDSLNMNQTRWPVAYSTRHESLACAESNVSTPSPTAQWIRGNTERSTSPSLEPIEHEFHRACCQGDLAAVRRMLHDGTIQVDTPLGKSRRTVLHAASWHGQVEIVKELLKMGALATHRALDGRSPLLWACASGHREVVDLLLQCLPKTEVVNAMDNELRTALHHAAFQGHGDLVSFLVNYGVNVQCKDKFGNTPLDLALQQEHTEVASELETVGGLTPRQSPLAMRHRVKHQSTEDAAEVGVKTRAALEQANIRRQEARLLLEDAGRF